MRLPHARSDGNNETNAFKSKDGRSAIKRFCKSPIQRVSTKRISLTLEAEKSRCG